MQSGRDEPVSPAGRLFLQSKTELIINCSIGFKNPLEPEAMKTYFANSLFMKHPRFCSLLVVDAKGREFWRKTKINIDDHVIIHPKNPSLECESEEECEDKINAILADYAVSSPLCMEKPLWELHIISELKCMIFRFHHAMGDGISLMSLFLATCKRLCDGKDAVSDVNVSENKKGEIKKRKGKGNPFIGILKVIWWTILSVMEVIGRSLWVRDKKTAISGGDGVELWPRMVATAKFTLEDMKTVKRTIPQAVSVGVVIFRPIVRHCPKTIRFFSLFFYFATLFSLFMIISSIYKVMIFLFSEALRLFSLTETFVVLVPWKKCKR